MKKKAKEIITDYFLEGWNVNPDDWFEIEYVDARQFLRPERIDLICKLVYIDCKVNNRNIKFAKELYTEHIRAFSNGTFTEPGTQEKDTIEKYVDSFNLLIDKAPIEGLSAEKSVVGVGEDGNILDGSHRTAIAIYFRLPLPIIHIPNRAVNYDYEFFIARGLEKCYLDYMAYQFVLLSENVFSLCLWPIADDLEKEKIVERYVSECSSIVYRKNIKLNYHGLAHLMIHAYGNGRDIDKWAGNEDNGFEGVYGKANCCYKKYGLTTVYILTNTDLDKMVKLKSDIRKLYNIDNHSVHITDTKQETINISQVVLNDNSIDLLNNGDPFKYPSFVSKIKFFREAMLENNCSFDDYVIDSGSVLALYGLREADDIDYISIIDDKLPASEMFENHIEWNKRYLYMPLIYDPRNYLYYRGIKYVSLENVRQMKCNRNAEKDVSDIKLIHRLFYRRLKRLPNHWRIDLLKKQIKKRYHGNFFVNKLIKNCKSFRFKILKNNLD